MFAATHRYWLSLLLLMMAFSGRAGEAHIVTALDWDRPRSGDMVLAIEAVRAAVAELHAKPGSLLVIHHTGDEENLLWAEELRGWLVALAIPSKHISLQTSPISPDHIELRITAN